MSAKLTFANADRPILIQGSDAPIIRMVDGNSADLCCNNCGHVLVEGYHAECVIGVGLECHRCNCVTWTASRRSGQRFPRNVVTLGDKGRLLVGSTVVQSISVVVTCDQELAAEKKEMGPRPADPDPLEMSEAGLNFIATEIDVLSGGAFTPHLLSAERAFDSGEHRFLENELAWAITLLRRNLAEGSVDLDDIDVLLALAFVITTRSVLSRWRSHPTASRRASELCSEFRHAWSLLVAASYLEDHGNPISFNPTGPGRTADLFLRISATEKLYFEIKTPKSLAWPHSNASHTRLKRTVEGCLRKARKQIGRQRPGLLVIGSTCIEPSGLVAQLARAVRSVLRSKGSNHRGIAAIAIVGLDDVSLRRTGDHSMNFGGKFRVVPVKNPYYFADNPIRP